MDGSRFENTLPLATIKITNSFGFIIYQIDQFSPQLVNFNVKLMRMKVANRERIQ